MAPYLNVMIFITFPHPDAYATFQIDVENPCVIMSQDKSREFLHSGNDKDKFKVISSFSFLLIPLYQYVCFPKFYFMHWTVCGLMGVNGIV